MEKFNFKNRIQSNPRLLRLKNPTTGEIIDYEIQDLQESEIVENGTEMTAEVLNTMQNNIEESCVAVSPTQPETNEKVWIQKGKNYFKDSMVRILANVEYNSGTFTQKTADTNQDPYWKISALDNNYNFINEIATQFPSLGTNSFTFVKKSNFNNLQFGVNGSTLDTTIVINVNDLTDEETYTISFNVLNKTQGSISWKDIQIEQGSTATEYEEYIEETIWVKNDNGVYIPFVPKNKPINITTGEEFETGRIIDGKKEYGKRIDCGKLPDSTYKDVETGLSNVNYLDWSGVAVENTSSSGWPYKILTGDSSTLPTVSINGNKLRITTPSSAFIPYTGYITIYYTKN